MRLPADGHSAHIVRLAGALILAVALAACGGGSGAAGGLAPSAAPLYGPRGDYPVVVGDPYSVAGTTYTPEDVLNYDEVGFLTADPSAASLTKRALRPSAGNLICKQPHTHRVVVRAVIFEDDPIILS